MTQKEFIQNVLITEIGNIVPKYQFLSFVLMSSGIELLGKCIELSGKDFDIANESANRFRLAIDQLFPEIYKQYNNINNEKNFECDLYTELRCGMSHSLLPKQKIALTKKEFGHKNLSTQNSLLILVAEDFYNDFKIACEAVIARIDRKEIQDRFSLNIGH